MSILPNQLAASSAIKLVNANGFFFARPDFKTDGLTEKEDRDLSRVAMCILVVGSFAGGNEISKISAFARELNGERHWSSCAAGAMLESETVVKIP